MSLDKADCTLWRGGWCRNVPHNTGASPAGTGGSCTRAVSRRQSIAQDEL